MKVKKAGCILINKETKQVGLVFRNKHNDYSFPKGHLENDETLIECAIRETEEETGRKCIILNEHPIGKQQYIDSQNDETEVYFYLAKDNGQSTRQIDEKDKENLRWINIKDIENSLSYQNLKDFWNQIKEEVEKEIYND